VQDYASLQVAVVIWAVIIIITEFLVRLLHQEHRCITVS